MSKEAALTFLKHVSEKPELQEKLAQFAKEQGYEFAVDELSVEELRGVAGGTAGVKKTMQTQV
jgi:hypothetical protein